MTGRHRSRAEDALVVRATPAGGGSPAEGEGAAGGVDPFAGPALAGQARIDNGVVVRPSA